MANYSVDPYSVLGVMKTAKQDEIKDAYRKLAKKLHPDLNPGNQEAERKFKDISRAYELIGSSEKREKFDRGEAEEAAAGAGADQRFWRRSGERPYYYETQEGGPHGGSRYTHSFGDGFDEDVFSSFFGGAAGRGGGARSFRGGHTGPQKGEDRLYQLDVDLKDAVLGAEKEIAFGSGKRLAVKIPAGVVDGTRLRFAGQGDPGIEGGAAGDAYVEVRVRPDERFRRVGADLEYELPITLMEAIQGGEVRVPTLGGEVLLKIPPRSNTGKRLRLPQKGIYDRRANERGDQIVILQVMLPERIDEELEAQLSHWSDQNPYSPRTGRGQTSAA